MSAALQDPQPQGQGQTDTEAELRILSGRHAGASVPLHARLRLGQGDDCDIILSDLALPQGSAWLQAGDGRWRVTAANPAAPADDAATNDPVMAQDMTEDELLAPLAWGQVGQLGGIALTVSAPHAPWQRGTPATPRTGTRPTLKTAPPATTAKAAPVADMPPASPADMPPASPADPAAPALPTQPEHPTPVPTSAQTAQATPAHSPANLPARPSARTAVLAIAAALLLAAGVLLALWADPGAAPPPASASASASPAPDPAQQQRQINDIRLALAGVDPALRLPVEPLPDGQVRVRGWLASIEQLDRVTEALAQLRPAPQLALRTTADLLDDLRAVAAGFPQPLQFALTATGQVQVQGSVPTAALHDQLLAALRERLPAGVPLQDAVRIAERQGDAVRQWLEQAGLPGASVRWDSDAGQLQIELAVTAQQRSQLEQLLAQPRQPLIGLPFTLHTRELATPASTTTLLHASAAPLPFRIRGVVGGDAPYVVLADGTKLQPGSQRSQWRLERIDPDTLTFSGPRRLVLTR